MGHPFPWPAFAGWLPDELDMRRKAIVYRAFADLGICENPPGSNRSGRIDEYNARAGAPEGSFWCASEATAVWEDCGLEVPPTARASTSAILVWAKQTKRWKEPGGLYVPQIGDWILYGTKEGAALRPEHIGILVRTSPYRLSIEGNTAWGGTFSRNGECCTLKNVEDHAGRVLGYVSPFPL